MTDSLERSPRKSRRATALRRVLGCAVAGVVVGVAAAFLTPWQVAVLLAWIATSLVFCLWVWVAVHDADPEMTRRLATREDDSRAAADVVLIAACVASLIGVGLTLLKASTQLGLTQVLITTVAVVTVAVSWLDVHTVFTLRYAHLFYREGGGIDFHGDEQPCFRDFAYVAFTLGMTYQVSDTNLTSQDIRSAALRHALLSYVFGIAVIAMTINVIASLIRR